MVLRILADIPVLPSPSPADPAPSPHTATTIVPADFPILKNSGCGFDLYFVRGYTIDR
jgi:hypothetical protein